MQKRWNEYYKQYWQNVSEKKTSLGRKKRNNLKINEAIIKINYKKASKVK